MGWEPAASVLRYCAMGWVVVFPLQMVFAATRAFGYQPLLTFQAFVSTMLSLVILFATQGHQSESVGLAWASRQLPIFACGLIAIYWLFTGTLRDFVTALIRPTVASLFMVVSVLLATNDLGPIYRLGVQVAVGVSAYALAVCALDPNFVKFLAGLVRRGVSGSKLPIN
jgi:hypothetical protein